MCQIPAAPKPQLQAPPGARRPPPPQAAKPAPAPPPASAKHPAAAPSTVAKSAHVGSSIPVKPPVPVGGKLGKPSLIPPASKASKAAGQKRVARTLYNFMAQKEGDLNVEDGDIVDLLDTSDADWWMVRQQRSGATGMLPASYLEEIFATDYQVGSCIRVLLTFKIKWMHSTPHSLVHLN